uniref:Copia protein n=1 Tax=Tanacetum cinerariifolium TaxID=118510 RepID=A0A699GMG4_TANCI|nr:copia protein [Tanacetum cinerariifolium]
MYYTFSKMLKNFDTEDIEVLWRLVKDRFIKSKPVDDMDSFLLQTLKTMFEHHVKDTVWRNQQELAKVKNLKLFDSCGVYCVTMQNIVYYLLVEKMYQLTNHTLHQMFNNVKLQVDEECEMDFELLRLEKEPGTDYTLLPLWTSDLPFPQESKSSQDATFKPSNDVGKKGHIQEEGIDYDKVFAPVARIEAIRLFLVYASFKDFVVYQIDVKSAFLYEKIEEEVYVCQPSRFENSNFLDKVYKVEKALYGLHQAPIACDYAGASLDRKSTTRGFQFLGCRLISWRWKKQTVVTNSTIEAEYVAASSCCGQFWTTTKSKAVNGEVQIHALVDGMKVIITESSVRRDLQLAYEDGIDCLLNPTIFENLALMEYEKCLSPKQTAWNEFSSTIASAIICLATNKTFNFSKMIFDGMPRNLDNVSGFSGKETPLFPIMVGPNQVQMGEGLTQPTDTQHTPTFDMPLPKPKKTQKPRRQDTMRDTSTHTRVISSSDDEALDKSKQGRIDEIDADEDIAMEEVVEVVTTAKMIIDVVVVALQVTTAIADITEKSYDLRARGNKNNKSSFFTTTSGSGQRLHEKEKLQLTDAEKAKLFMEFMKKRRKLFAAKRYEEKRNKTPTKAQQRSIMITYLKNMDGWKPRALKNKSFAEIQELFDKEMKRINSFVDFRTELVEKSTKKKEAETAQERSLKREGDELEQEGSKKQKMEDDKESAELKQCLEIIPDDGDEVTIDATPLSFNKLLKFFDKEDLEVLWRLVKARFEKVQPVDHMDSFLLHTLKIMFEHHVEDNVWKNQQGLVKVKNWKLYDSCGVYCVTK